GAWASRARRWHSAPRRQLARETRIVVDRGEVLVRPRVLPVALVLRDGFVEMPQCALSVTGERLDTAEVVQEGRVAGLGSQALLHQPLRLVVVPGLQVRRGDEEVL